MWLCSYENTSTNMLELFEMGILRPSEHYEGNVELVSLSNHTATGQAQSSKLLTSTYAHPLARN